MLQLVRIMGCGMAVVACCLGAARAATPDETINDALARLRIDAAPNPHQLGVWDRNTRQFLNLDSQEIIARLATARTMRVWTHGWLPQAEEQVNALRGLEPPMTVWDPRFARDGQPLLPNLIRFADAFSADDNNSVIVAFSWIEDAAQPNPEEAIDRTRVNGMRLAALLTKATSAGWRSNGGMIHLLGHSAGARLMCEAAVLMDPPPEQLTLLDAPEVSLPPISTPVDLNYIVLGEAMANGRIRIGRGSGQTFIDNYTSLLGIPYGSMAVTNGIIDVRLTPPPEADPHLYAEEWYIRAAESRAQIGPAWSPLVGQLAPPAPYFAQAERAENDSGLEFQLVSLPPAPRLATYTLDPSLQSNSMDGPALANPGPRLSMTEHGAAIWTATMPIDDPDKALTFEYLFDGFQPETRVFVWVEDELRFVSRNPTEEPGLPQTGGESKWQRATVGLSNVGRGPKTIRIGLRNTGGGIRVEAFAKVSLPDINRTYPLDACGLISPYIFGGLAGGLCYLRGHVRRRIRRQ